MKLAMDLEPLDHAMFHSCYALDQLHLNSTQADLFAHLASWNVASEEEVSGFPGNAEVVRGLLGP